MLLICHPESVEPSQEEVAADPVHQAWLEDVTGRGLFVGGSRLRPAREARSVRVRKGKSHVIDGPFAETKEVVGGYVVVECDSIDDAIAVAAGHPFARHGTIEVRPVWESVD
jgi:hypothetical protein